MLSTGLERCWCRPFPNATFSAPKGKASGKSRFLDRFALPIHRKALVIGLLAAVVVALGMVPSSSHGRGHVGGRHHEHGSTGGCSKSEAHYKGNRSNIAETEVGQAD